MISLDHLFLRFLLLGMAASLFTGLYLAGRHWKPRWFDRRLRKLVWLFILILPLLAVPWPLPVLIPADTPDWVIAARLPDPRIIFPGTDLIEKANSSYRREPMIRPSSRTDKPDQNGRESKSESLRQQNLLQTQITPWFWLLDHLAAIRLIFLAGLALNVMIRLISQPGWRRRRNRQGRAAPPPITDVFWLRDLAAVRDRCGDYRRGMLVEMEPPTASWLAIWRCRRRGWLPIAAAELACDNPNERQNSILSALDLCRHPDLLMLFLYSCWRYLAWFTPFAWLPASFFRQDQLLWHQEGQQRQICRLRRCRTRPEQQSDPVVQPDHVQPGRRGRGQAGPWMARLVTGLLILILVCLAMWQNPILLAPDMARSWFLQQQLIQPFGLVIEGHDESDTGRAAASQYGIMAGPGQLIGYLDESDPKAAVSGIIAIGDEGGIRWQLPLSTIIDHDLAGSDDSGLQSPVQFSLSDYQELPEGGYTILGRIDMSAIDAMPLVIARITAEGQLADWQLFEDGTGDLAQTYWINGMTHKLLANGEVLVVDTNMLENPAALASYEMVSTLAATYTLRRLTAQGEAVASFSPDPDTLKTMNLGFWSRGAVSGYRRIARIIATPDGGFYLVIESALILMQIGGTPAPFYQHDNYYQPFNGSDQVARLSAEGKLLWLRELGEREMIVAVNQAVAGADGCLYLAATARYRRLQLMLPADSQLDRQSRIQRTPDMSGPFYPYREAYQKAALYALAPDGRLLWQKELYGEHGAQATQIALQDQDLTLLVDHDPYMGLAVQLLPRGLSCQSIWQYDLSGQLKAYAPLPKADDYLEQPWFFVRPGFVLLPDQPG